MISIKVFEGTTVGHAKLIEEKEASLSDALAFLVNDLLMKNDIVDRLDNMFVPLVIVRHGTKYSRPQFVHFNYHEGFASELMALLMTAQWYAEATHRCSEHVFRNNLPRR